MTEAKKLIQNANTISILLPPDTQEDNLSSALALFYSLKKQGKKTDILLPKHLLEKTQSSGIYKLLQPKNFVISIDAPNTKISEIFYEKNEKNLKICLAVSAGQIEEKDVDFSFLSLKPLTALAEKTPDLLITLGFQTEEGLPEKIPILNIDNHAGGKDFGKINLREEKSSLAQISTKLIAEPDKNIATSLLAGIIYFSLQNKTPIIPKVFEAISYLIKKGADIQKIVQHLKTETKSTNKSIAEISQIRLLGKVLEKLEYKENKELYCAILTNEDFQEMEAGSLDLNFVITELKNVWLFPCLLVLWEDKAATKGVFYSSQPEAIKKILKTFTGTLKGEGGIFLVPGADLTAAQAQILKLL